MTSTGDATFDAILERASEIRAETRIARPAPPPARPADFSIDLGAYRMMVAFVPIGSTEKAA
jgi:hypothetical protein